MRIFKVGFSPDVEKDGGFNFNNSTETKTLNPAYAARIFMDKVYSARHRVSNRWSGKWDEVCDDTGDFIEPRVVVESPDGNIEEFDINIEWIPFFQTEKVED